MVKKRKSFLRERTCSMTGKGTKHLNKAEIQGIHMQSGKYSYFPISPGNWEWWVRQLLELKGTLWIIYFRGWLEWDPPWHKLQHQTRTLWRCKAPGPLLAPHLGLLNRKLCHQPSHQPSRWFSSIGIVWPLARTDEETESSERGEGSKHKNKTKEWPWGTPYHLFLFYLKLFVNM